MEQEVQGLRLRQLLGRVSLVFVDTMLHSVLRSCVIASTDAYSFTFLHERRFERRFKGGSEMLACGGRGAGRQEFVILRVWLL